MTWSRLQGELASTRTTAKTPSTALGVISKRAEGTECVEQTEAGETCLAESRKCTGEQRQQDIGNEKLKSDKQNGSWTLGKKRKRDDEEAEEKRKSAAVESNNDKNVEKGKTSKERKREEHKEGAMDIGFMGCRKNETDVNGRGSVSDHSTTRLEHNIKTSSRMLDDTGKNFAVENVKCENTTEERDTDLLATCKEMSSFGAVSFRISCKCTGSLSRCLSTQEVNKVIGVGLSKWLGWRAELKNPQLEINVYLSDDHCLLGIPLSRLPLASRSYIKTTGLRSTIAWAMASLAQIQPGFRVLDPMCGVGTILIEAAQEHTAACFLGMDNDDGQLQRASENVAYADLGNRIQLLKASSVVLPLPSASVDAVICDLPFGRKFSTKINMAANLLLILTEMERVLCAGGTLVLLLSPQLSCLLKKILIQKDTGPTSTQETKPQTGIHKHSSPSESQSNQQIFQIHPGIKSSSSWEMGPQHSLPSHLFSLRHQTTLRVSLGAIDGLLHKYVKQTL
ncbi:THUMP domain-containing protein 2 isoform X2 [Parambassis ranga]|nr:THUMP domain-containing protein 2 isoform X2 [Parambassis ranga]